MPSSKAWTINCVLAGAQAFALLHQGKESDARELIRNLSSDLTLEDMDYIIHRFKEVEQLMDGAKKLGAQREERGGQ